MLLYKLYKMYFNFYYKIIKFDLINKYYYSFFKKIIKLIKICFIINVLYFKKLIKNMFLFNLILNKNKNILLKIKGLVKTIKLLSKINLLSKLFAVFVLILNKIILTLYLKKKNFNFESNFLKLIKIHFMLKKFKKKEYNFVSNNFKQH